MPLPRTQPSRRAPGDGCIARTMRKPNHARLTAAVALLFWSGVRLLVRHGCSRAESPARTTALASGERSASGVARRTWVPEERPVGVPPGARSTTKQRPARARFGRRLSQAGQAPESGDGIRVRFSEGVSSPSSGQGVGDGCADSRGGPALPASPAAGLLPIRPRPSRPAPDREWGLGRRGAVAQTSNPALNCRGDGDGTAAGSAAKATPTRATCGSVPCGRCSYRIVARDGCPLRPALLPYAQEVVTVQLLVSITRFVAAGGESWGYGSRRGRGGL